MLQCAEEPQAPNALTGSTSPGIRRLASPRAGSLSYGVGRDHSRPQGLR